jgi:penicillin-binding protein 2
VILGLFLLLAGRLFYLQIVRGKDYAWQATENMIRREPIPALRGRVFDRDGRLLAGNRVSFSVSLEGGHPAYTRPEPLRAGAEEVAAVLGRDPVEIAQRVLGNRDRFEPVQLARDLEASSLARLVERLDPIPGLTVGRAPIRWYPNGGLAAHVLGYVGEVGEEELRESAGSPRYRRGCAIGRFGIEGQYEWLLRGEAGITYVDVDALGRKTDLFPGRPPRPAVPGADLHLFLDAELQATAEQALREAASPPGGRSGPVCAAVVALAPWSGEVLACASAPAFDPNAFAHGLTQAQWDSLNQPHHPLLNRASQAAYPPASIFKIVTTLAGLDDGLLTEETRFDPCTGGYPFGDRVFGCWKKTGHGGLNLLQAFEQSCDVYYYQVARAMGLERLLDFAGSLGLDACSGIDLPQEREGLMPTMEWYRQRLGYSPPGGYALNLAIGQGELLLTPVAIAVFVAALVTDGVVRRPRLAGWAVARGGDEIWEQREPIAVRKLGISERDRLTLRRLLREVVEGEQGTGRRARIEGWAIGGKTGTAQNPHGEDHSLFVGVAPVDAPRLVVVVVAEASGHGSTVAAPIARSVMEAFLKEPAAVQEHITQALAR